MSTGCVAMIISIKVISSVIISPYLVRLVTALLM